MKNPLSAALLAFVAFAVAVAAQAPPPPALPDTPSGCLRSARDYRQVLMKDVQARLKEAARQVTQDDVNLVGTRTADFAAACAAQFAGRDLPAADMAALAELQVEAQQLDAARQTIGRALAAPGADAAAKAATLATGVRILSRQIRQPGMLDQAEAWVDGLEKLPASFVRERIEAHGVLNGYYRADDIDAGIIRHSTRLIELNAALPADQRTPQLSNTIVAAYSNLAEAWAGQEQTAKALDLLRRAPAELKGVRRRRRAPRADDRAVRTGREARGRHRGAGVAERTRGHREARDGRRRDVAAVHRALVRALPRSVPGRGAPPEAVRRARASAS